MTTSTTQNILVIVTLVAIIGGFFLGKVAPEFFYATVGGIITHFYQGSKVSALEKTVSEQSVRIQSLKDA